MWIPQNAMKGPSCYWLLENHQKPLLNHQSTNLVGHVECLIGPSVTSETPPSFNPGEHILPDPTQMLPPQWCPPCSHSMYHPAFTYRSSSWWLAKAVMSMSRSSIGTQTMSYFHISYCGLGTYWSSKIQSIFPSFYGNIRISTHPYLLRTQNMGPNFTKIVAVP